MNTKGFLFLMFIVCVGLFTIDWLKSTAFFRGYRGSVIRFQTLFLITSGILIMRFTLDKASYRTFIFLYSGIWAVYFLIKYCIIAAIRDVSGLQYSGYAVVANNFKFILMSTPFPFLAFWLLHKVYILHFSAKEHH